MTAPDGPRRWADYPRDMADAVRPYGGTPDDRRARSVREGQRDARRAAYRQAKARTIYAVGAAQLIIVICYAVFAGRWDWASIIPTSTLCALLILAALDDGRLW